MFKQAPAPLLAGAAILTATFAAHLTIAYVRRSRRVLELGLLAVAVTVFLPWAMCAGLFLP
jgi:hypothetical protein